MFCRYCGLENSDDARFCKGCGSVFTKYTENAGQGYDAAQGDVGQGYDAAQGDVGQDRQAEAYAPAGASRALQIGTVLCGKYRVDGVIGEGGFGITYLVWDTLIQTKAAIKEYFPSEWATRNTVSGKEQSTMITVFTGEYERLQYQKGLEKFAKEAENLAKLQRLPGIVSVRDFFFENGTAYMVMEYIEGITLKEFLEQQGGRIPVESAVQLLAPLMGSLAEVHRAGMVHRDISPDNIMITWNGELKLIDFGAARFVAGNGEKSLTVILKHGYAPEEQYRTNGNQGPWTDVYAFCAVIYRMVTGKVPPEVSSRIMGEADITAELRNCEGMSGQMIRAMRKGMEINADKRIQDMESLAAALFQKKRSKGILVASAAVAAAVLCIVLIAVFVRGGSRSDPEPPSDEVSLKESDSEDSRELEEEQKEEPKQEESAEEIEEEPPVDVDAVKAELYAKLEMSVSGELVDSYFGDFNSDGMYEIWAVYWDGDGLDYNACVPDESGDIPWPEIEAGGGVWGEYRQLKVWYADDSGVDLVDELITLVISEEYARGETTYWSEDTYYYPCGISLELLRFGSIEQLGINISYTWMTGRGWGIDIESEISLYGNDNGASLCLRVGESGFAVRDNILCRLASGYSPERREEEFYNPWGYNEILYYPIYYIGGKYLEIVNEEISLEQLSAFSNFEQVYETAAAEEIVFSAPYLVGALTNVLDAEARVCGMEVVNVLYNDTGYVYINYDATVECRGWFINLDEEVEEYLICPLCLELKVEGDEVTEYRWIDGNQDLSGTDFEKIRSDWNGR